MDTTRIKLTMPADAAAKIKADPEGFKRYVAALGFDVTDVRVSALPPELTRTAEWMIENHACQQFFIEYRNRDTYKGCGIKVLSAQEVEWGRIIGAYGAREETIIQPILLQRGHKLVEVKASAKKPLHCTTYLYPML